MNQGAGVLVATVIMGSKRKRTVFCERCSWAISSAIISARSLIKRAPRFFLAGQLTDIGHMLLIGSCRKGDCRGEGRRRITTVRGISLMSYRPEAYRDRGRCAGYIANFSIPFPCLKCLFAASMSARHTCGGGTNWHHFVNQLRFYF